MELGIELYFWMIDRGDVVDDQRNSVDPAAGRVRLFREHSQRLLNGVYIGKVMQAIRKIIIKKSKRPFTLDPVLSSLKDQSVVAAREYNWGYIVVELKKFNIKISKEQKNQIVYDSAHSIILDVLE